MGWSVEEGREIQIKEIRSRRGGKSQMEERKRVGNRRDGGKIGEKKKVKKKERGRKRKKGNGADGEEMR